MTTIERAKDISPEIKAELIMIGADMLKAGLPSQFVSSAVETAFRYEGVCELMQLWMEETDEAEREEIVADLQELVDDCTRVGHSVGTYISFDDLDAIAQDIRAFKDSLRILVDERGGISYLAKLTGIPQPSLSRMFNSVSMPQRSTLLKIAQALDLSEVQIATKWARH